MTTHSLAVKIFKNLSNNGVILEKCDLKVIEDTLDSIIKTPSNINLADKYYFYMISEAVRMTGTFNPDEVMPVFIDSLNQHEYKLIKNFLQWLHNNNLSFGSGNYEETIEMYKDSLKYMEEYE